MADVKENSLSSATEEKVPRYEEAQESELEVVTNGNGQLKRTLTSRQIQMVTVGGSIGTALFVTIGSGLIAGGPASLLIAFIIYCCWLGLVNSKFIPH